MGIDIRAIAYFGVLLIMGIGSFLTSNLGNSGKVYACTCAPVHPPEDAIAESTAVFSGRVIAIQKMDESYYQAIFDVEKSWKGIEEDPVTINTATSGDTCGYDFQLGNDYLVYAHGQTQPIGGRPELGTGICTRTAPVSNAQADLLVLGEGKNWTSSQSNYLIKERIIIGSSPLIMTIGVSLAIAGAIIGGVIGYRRWKRKK